MSITEALVLPADVVIVAASDLPEPLRDQLAPDEGDFAVSRPRSRTPTKIVDAGTAELLRAFQDGRTLVDVVIEYSRAHDVDPEQTLVDAYPLIERFMSAGLLVPAGSTSADEIAQSFRTGDLCGAFEVMRCLQVLEDTELYQARSAVSGDVALKITRSDGNRSTLDREAAILRHLDGSVSPRLIDAGVHDDLAYLAIQWRPGIPADVYVEHARQNGDRERIVALCLAVLDAYVRLHDAGVVHADVHPRNLLIDHDGTLTIIDFGLAIRDADNPVLHSAPRGGVGFFFEPEYAAAILDRRRPPDASPAGEQYAVAAMLYLFLTGQHYVDFVLDQAAMLRQIAFDEPRAFANLGAPFSPGIEKVLRQAFSKQPSDRFGSLAEFADAFRQAVSAATAPPTRDAPNQKAHPAATAVLDDVLSRVDLGGALFASGVATAPTVSVNYGAAGIAYALYRLAAIRDEAALLSTADAWITKALAELHTAGAFYNPAMELTTETVGTNALFHSPTGVYCVHALIANSMGDVVSRNLAIDSFVGVASEPTDLLDITLGKAGAIVGSILLLDIAPDHEGLLALGNALLEEIWTVLDGYGSIAAVGELTNLGAAHGWAGLLYSTLLWSTATGAPLPVNASDRLTQLAGCAEEVGRGLRWPWMLDRAPGYAMAGWCNGSAGYVHLWTAAHDLLKEEQFATLAERAAWDTWENQDAVGNLCCGSAGRAYALLNLFKHSGDATWLERAGRLAERAASIARNPPRHVNPAEIPPNSLYKGEIGIALLTADLERPTSACMPLFEREGW